MTNLIILQAGGAGGLLQFAPMLIVLVIIFFFFIKPQQKRQKEQAAFMNDLTKGKDVVTSSGIIGKISKIDANEVTLQVDQKSFMRVTKGSISREMTEAFENQGKKSEK